ncbi:MFS general substrate transporter [Aspergillus heteromorphus CBS 117.55]|uniref:MFS general substrate transporter n=1 Tax=Aspergillus heteromorphus CBS 117.55 TaxID=1448321 RepID=A0A317VT73_9EURO|nr:MFS general substrate transporter [Aspergillus heteromorphus CBS 117.55]PWY77523.1 MFS general substrate transporter [Aspergillus heteromorphus CBS 117.55]
MSLVIARSVPKRNDSSQGSNPLTVSDIEKKTVIVTQHPAGACADDTAVSTSSDSRRSWFRRSKACDPNAIATQPSVYDDPELAEEYKPRPDWEGIHRFDPAARWTWAEENKIVRKLDTRIVLWACVMITALELDKSNIQQANADNFLTDLHLNRDDYNLGNTLYRLCYLLSEIPTQIICKKIGADRWLPIQMVSWSIVAGCQFWLTNRESFLVCRALIGIMSGGFTPAVSGSMNVILYLSYFYKHHELSIRLGYWYAASSLADILAGFLAFGILHIGGRAGEAGWRWLFLIEGLMTLTLGLLSFVLLPPSPTQTAHWARGKKGWFTAREETIMVNRIIREDPSKGSMHNRQPLTAKLLWMSIKDYDLWPLYIIGVMFLTPWTTISQYFTLQMKDFGFNTFNTVLLAIPSNVLQIVTRILITYAGEMFGSLALMGVLAQLWCLPLMIYMNAGDLSRTNKWVVWTVLTLLQGFPNTHALQAGWVSRNSNSVRTRAIAAAMYNMAVQLSAIIASNVYQDWDAPRYVVGNRVLLALISTNIVLYLATKAYYMLRNRQRDCKWNAMTEDQRVDYVATTKDEGNRRMDFRFAH